ncbi:hypothetical protein B0J11DRAFT_498103 [Dendryphion nanum]|uniref:RING-type domain-containing protein n=1 Tax=Dendryphion nanum TaxID=256645 RepID=A0A9P9I909_9PLEO|nr:hypothetical protein B0J11DRAFT_498103 [Dendryphion nanum]
MAPSSPATSTPSEGRNGEESNSNALGLVLPLTGLLLFIIVLIVLTRWAASKKPGQTDGPKRRLKQLDGVLPSVIFQIWHGNSQINQANQLLDDSQDDRICVICLELIKEHDSVRALECQHIYHTPCFDRWYIGFHDFCPLCHRSVISAKDVTMV